MLYIYFFSLSKLLFSFVTLATTVCHPFRHISSSSSSSSSFFRLTHALAHALPRDPHLIPRISLTASPHPPSSLSPQRHSSLILLRLWLSSLVITSFYSSLICLLKLVRSWCVYDLGNVKMLRVCYVTRSHLSPSSLLQSVR